MEYSLRKTVAFLLFIAVIICMLFSKDQAFGFFFWANVAWAVICAISCATYGNSQDLETGYKSLILSLITLIISLIYRS